MSEVVCMRELPDRNARLTSCLAQEASVSR